MYENDFEMQEYFRNMNNPYYLPTKSMTNLYDEVYPPKTPIIENLLYNGTYLFVGAPKVGKSFFMAQIAYHISKGIDVWNYKVNKGTVLYLALEDDYARLQRRLYTMFGESENDNLYLATTSHQLNDGLDKQLEYFIETHKDTKLIIIDTLQKIRELSGDKCSYGNDYDIVTKLKKFSDNKNVCLLLVHHTRKQQADDCFETISGTNGLLGAADGAFILQKEKRTSSKAVLDAVGRDQQDQRLYLEFNREHCLWEFTKAENEIWKLPSDSVLESVSQIVTPEITQWSGINALEINNDIDMDESPVSIKSEFLISLFDQLLKSNDSRLGGGVGAKDKSIIDRCAIKVYGDFLNGKSEYMPTLVDFRNELLRQPEDEAQDLALSLEIFTTGSLDAFAHQSDVNTNNRIVAYDILELGEQMKSIGLLIMLDNIFNRVMANRRRGKYTRVYVDEAHLYFKNPYSADFLLKCWKRFRKYGGLLTGITQNISDCLLNETARGMLSNSEFLLLLNQAPSDRKDLSELLSISDTQMSYITNAGAGRGLIKVGGSIVPFINEFPTDTELYKLMSTKPGEG